MTYWNHKITGEYDKSYEYEHPLFKKQMSIVKYIQGFKSGIARWIAADVENIKFEGDSALVDVRLKTKVKIPRAKPYENEAVIKENWVKVDGLWYHVPAALTNS